MLPTFLAGAQGAAPGPRGVVHQNGIASSTTTLHYTGQRRDDTGLVYYHARYYDPRLGRFLSPDTLVPSTPEGSMDGVALSPLTVAFHDPAFNAALGPELRASDTDRDTLHGGGPYNPQDLNRYSYARNNPVRYTDPTGHWTFSIDVSISGGAYLGGSISGGLVIDGHGNVDVYQTTQWGGTIGASVGLSGGATITGADTIDQTTGPGFEIGINTPIVSANVPIGGNKDYAGFGLAFGPAAGGDIHINKTNTVTKPASSLNPITKMKEIYREGERALRDTIVSAKYR